MEKAIDINTPVYETHIEVARRVQPFPDCSCSNCYAKHNKIPYSMKREMREADREFRGLLD